MPGTGLDYFSKVNVCVRNTGSMTVSAEAKSTCDKVVKIAEDCKYLVDGFRDKTLIPLSYRSSRWTKCWCLQSCKYRGHNNKRKWSFSCSESPIRLFDNFNYYVYSGSSCSMQERYITHSLLGWPLLMLTQHEKGDIKMIWRTILVIHCWCSDKRKMIYL